MARVGEGTIDCSRLAIDGDAMRDALDASYGQ